VMYFHCREIDSGNFTIRKMLSFSNKASIKKSRLGLMSFPS
jgi:hypothetical protein